jgi:hypothetical protein
MRLYASKIPTIVEAIVRTIVEGGDIEVSDKNEFKQDCEAILREYLRVDRDLTERAKDQMEARGLPYSDLFKVRRTLAEEIDFGIGDEGANWIANQLVEMFSASGFVEEIFVEDPMLRRKLRDLLKRHMQADADLDREVRKHLRHLDEGTSSFEIEYQKQLDLVRRKHGLG